MQLSYNIDITKLKNTKLAAKIRAIDPNKMNRFFVLLVYIAGVIFYFCLANYKKTIAIYNDEMLYYDQARSIFQGKGLIVRGVDFGFRKIGYSLLIAPLFAIGNVELRITMISLLNSLVMISTVFPAYFIAKDINMKRGSMYLFLIFVALWPGMLMTETFMAEVLYMPLVWWFVFLWVKEQKAPDKIVYPVLEGTVCFWGYLTKEIFLSVFVTYFLVKLMYPFVSAIFCDSEKKGGFWKTVRSGYSPKMFKNAAIFGAVFVFLHILSLVFFSDSNLYSEAFSRELTLYKILYCIYGIVFYVSAVVVALLVFPFVYPLALFKKMDENVRKLICFAYCDLLLSVATISYTILMYEDVGKSDMRVHLRYISPVLLLIMFLFVRVVSDREKVTEHLKTRNFTVWWGLIVSAIASVVFFRGVRKGAYVDQHELRWFKIIDNTVGSVSPDNGETMDIPLYSLVVGLILLIFIIVGQLLISKKKFDKFYVGFALIWLLASSVNLYEGHILTKAITSSEEHYVVETKKLTDYIDNRLDEECVLYILSDSGNVKRYVDSYIDKMDNIYFISGEQALELSEIGSFPVNTVKFVELMFELEYDTVERIDYIVCQRSAKLIGFSNVELISEASGEEYIVYKNLDNTTLNFIDTAAPYRVDKDRTVSFGAENDDKSYYIKRGLANPEEGFSWSISNKLSAEIPIAEGYGQVRITFNCVDTFNGTQRYSVNQDDILITQGEIYGVGKITFTVPVEGNKAKFDIYFPDAIRPSEVTESYDERQIAMAFDSMEIVPLAD